MKRFRKGELAITCNANWPQVNDGHLVVIVRVVGPRLDWGMSFAYQVEKVDGKPFPICVDVETRIPRRGGVRAYGNQHQLRPLRGRSEGSSAVQQDLFLAESGAPAC